MVRCIIGFTSE